MTNQKTKRFGFAALGVFVLGVFFSKNIEAVLIAWGLDDLFVQLDIGAAFGATGRFLISPLLTHIYAFAIGALTIPSLRLLFARNAPAHPPRDLHLKPNMTLGAVVRYLRSESQWGTDHPDASDAMVERELKDYIVAGHLKAMARVRTYFGENSPLTTVSAQDFHYMRFDIPAAEAGREDAVTSDQGVDDYNDFHFWKSQVETIWPRRPSR